jgi:hypothetical protein
MDTRPQTVAGEFFLRIFPFLKPDWSEYLRTSH